MTQKGLGGFFEKFLEKEPLFANKKILQSSYMPDSVPHREPQITQVAQVLAPALRTETPSNLFIYGKTGTGKTLVVRHVVKQMLDLSSQRNIPLKIIYINCKLKGVADTEYRLVAQMAREFGKAVPPTGLPTDEVYKIFFDILDREKMPVVVVLDEIDRLVEKTGDGILYNLIRINSELKNSQIALIGISNDPQFTNNLDPRVKSSLSEEVLVFPPYNALQIQSILKQRAKLAFKEGIIKPGVIEKCSAYAAREHGDARRALELLRVAGELAERGGNTKIHIKHIDEAEEKIERDWVLDVIAVQPKQFQATLYSIFAVSEKRKESISAGEVYGIYKRVCSQTGLRPLTQRRVSDIINELDMLGILNAKVISKGRYGRTREISLTVPSTTEQEVKNILKNSLDL